MRIFEIASAEEQIELWKLVSTSMWQAMEQQQREEQKRQADAAAKKHKASKGAKGKAYTNPVPLPSPMPAPSPAAEQPAKAKPSDLAVTLGSMPKANELQPQSPNSQAPALSQSNAKKLPASALADPLKSVDITDKEPANGEKKSDDDTDDRHSKNTFQPTVARYPLRR